MLSANETTEPGVDPVLPLEQLARWLIGTTTTLRSASRSG